MDAETRRRMERGILEAYRTEVEAAKKPGYVPESFPDLDYDEPPADAAQP